MSKVSDNEHGRIIGLVTSHFKVKKKYRRYTTKELDEVLTRILVHEVTKCNGTIEECSSCYFVRGEDSSVQTVHDIIRHVKVSEEFLPFPFNRWYCQFYNIELKELMDVADTVCKRIVDFDYNFKSKE